MSLDSVLAQYGGRSVTPVTPAVTPDVTPEPAWIGACTPVTPVTPENQSTANEPPTDPAGRLALTDRQTKALAILKADPALRRAFAGEPTPDGYRLAVAIRRPNGEIVVGEMVLPPSADPLRAITSCPA